VRGSYFEWVPDLASRGLNDGLSLDAGHAVALQLEFRQTVKLSEYRYGTQCR